jgi:error-prone DNA polymerase
MGSKFVCVTGRLQSESGVVHIVAQKIDDLTPWLSVLLEEPSQPGDQGRAPEVGPDRERMDRAILPHLGPFIRKNAPVSREAEEKLSRAASGVMPKGRNFQ